LQKNGGQTSRKCVLIVSEKSPKCWSHHLGHVEGTKNIRVPAKDPLPYWYGSFFLGLGWMADTQIIPNSPSGYGSVSKPCTPVVHIKIAGKWMFIPLKMVLIGIDPYPYGEQNLCNATCGGIEL